MHVTFEITQSVDMCIFCIVLAENVCWFCRTRAKGGKVQGGGLGAVMNTERIELL